MASCIQIKSLLQAYLDDELESGEKLLFEDHSMDALPAGRNLNGCGP